MSKYITECETDQSHTYLNQGNGCPLCRIATLEEGCRAFIADIDVKDKRIAALEKVADAAEQLLTHRDNDARVPTRKKEHGLIYKTTACRDDAEILMKKLSALRAAGYLKEQGE